MKKGINDIIYLAEINRNYLINYEKAIECYEKLLSVDGSNR